MQRIDKKAFAKTYVNNGRNGTKAVQALNPSQSYEVAAVTSTRLLKNAKVQELIEAEQENLLINMKNLAYNAESESVRFNATKDLLDRGNSTLKEEQTTTPTDNKAVSKEILEAIKNGDTVRLLEITNTPAKD